MLFFFSSQCKSDPTEWHFGTPSAFSSPSFALKVSAVGSCMYYLLLNPHGYLPTSFKLERDQGVFCIICLACCCSSIWTYGFKSAKEQKRD
jgi:hypothetical protein